MARATRISTPSATRQALPSSQRTSRCDGVSAAASGGSDQTEGGPRRWYGADSGDDGNVGPKTTVAMTHAVDVSSTVRTAATIPSADVMRMTASSWSALSVMPEIHVWSGGL